MNPRYTPADLNLTPLADPLLGSRLTTSLLLGLVFVFAGTGEKAGLIMAGLLFCVAWPAFILVWSRDAHVHPAKRNADAQIAPLLPLPTPSDVLRGILRLFVPAAAISHAIPRTAAA